MFSVQCSVFSRGKQFVTPRSAFRICLGVCAIAAGGAFAQENPVTRLPEIVVTGTRIPEELSRTPVAATVITRAEIEQKQARTVADLLRDQAGVDVSLTGQPGGNTSIFLRGANAGHTLVIVDGVRVNRPFDNSFNFANLPTDSIERVEILRGPQSTIYGSDAMGGVINIVTKAGAGKPTGSLLVEGGSNESLRTRGSFAMKQGKFSAAADASYLTMENGRINSDYWTWNVSTRAAYEFSEKFSASVVATWLKSDAGSPGDRTSDDPNDFYRVESKLVGVTFNAQPAPWWDARLILSHNGEHNLFRQPPPNPPFFFGDYTAQTLSDRDQVDFQNTFTIGERHKLLAGLTYDESAADYADSFGAFRAKVTTRSFYGQYEFAPVERLTLTAGGRVDDHSTFGTEPTGKFGARFTTPGTETILRANLGTGFRAPSLTDLYFPGAANPALRPEKSTGWDFGAEQPFLEGKAKIGTTWFQNEFRNLITFAFPAPTNVGRARTRGLENFAQFSPLTNLTLRATYTWLSTENLVTGAKLLRRPEQSGSVALNWQALRNVSATTTAKFVGGRLDTDPVTFGAAPNGGYVKWDLGLNWDVSKNLSLHGRVENLLGDRYEEVLGFPSLARTFWLGATAKF